MTLDLSKSFSPCPKGGRVEKTTPVATVRPPAAKSPTRKKTPKKVNKKRAAAEFKRCFHSKARQKFVQLRPCIVSNAECQYIAGISANAHVVKDGSEGASRKGGYKCIAPACDFHTVLDTQLRGEEFEKKYGISLQAKADATEAAWLARAA